MSNELLHIQKVLQAIVEGRRIRYSVIPSAEFRHYSLKVLMTYSLGTLVKFEIED